MDARSAAKAANGRQVVRCVSGLAAQLVPEASDDERQALTEYCLNVLGSLVGAGGSGGGSAAGPGAFWAAGDRLERRLHAGRRADSDIARFKLLRAELSTLHSITRKTWVEQQGWGWGAPDGGKA
jgi:hypothetical protein